MAHSHRVARVTAIAALAVMVTSLLVLVLHGARRVRLTGAATPRTLSPVAGF